MLLKMLDVCIIGLPIRWRSFTVALPTIFMHSNERVSCEIRALATW